MSAQPGRQSKPSPAASRGPGAGMFADALTAAASASARLQQSDARRQAACEAGACELLYDWQTEDDRDAEMRVYFHPFEQLEIVACVLEQLDGRPPTAQERVRYEDRFDEEMQAGGELWLQVASHVWERSWPC